MVHTVAITRFKSYKTLQVVWFLLVAFIFLFIFKSWLVWDARLLTFRLSRSPVSDLEPHTLTFSSVVPVLVDVVPVADVVVSIADVVVAGLACLSSCNGNVKRATSQQLLWSSKKYDNSGYCSCCSRCHAEHNSYIPPPLCTHIHTHTHSHTVVYTHMWHNMNCYSLYSFFCSVVPYLFIYL